MPTQQLKKSIKGKLSDDKERKRRIIASKQKYELQNHKVTYRLTNTEYALMREKAIGFGFRTLNQYAKKKLLIDSDTRFIPKSDLKTRMEINKIGVNLNQIARVLNTFKDTSRINEVHQTLQTIELQLGSLLVNIFNYDSKNGQE